VLAKPLALLLIAAALYLMAVTVEGDASVSVLSPLQQSPEGLRLISQRAAEGAQRYGLAPLTSSSAPELRVWVLPALDPSPSVVVITPASTTACGYRPSTSVGWPESGACTAVDSGQAWARIAQRVRMLRLYDGEHYWCPVIDGSDVLLQLALDGRLTLVRLSNPQACTGRDAERFGWLLADATGDPRWRANYPRSPPD